MNVNTAKTGFFSSTSGVLRSNAESAWNGFMFERTADQYFQMSDGETPCTSKQLKFTDVLSLNQSFGFRAEAISPCDFKLISKLLLRTDFKQFAATEFELKSTVIKKSQV